MKVVIADDNRKVSSMLVHVIREFFPHMEIDGEFNTGTALMNYLDNNTPDLMITDIVMPGFDGLEACRKLREKSSSAHIILITAFQKFEYAAAGISYHVDEFITKPYTTAQIVSAISRTVSFDISPLVQGVILALKKVELDSFLRENEKQFSALSSRELQFLLSETSRQLNLNLDITDFPTEDWQSCFHALAALYYNTDTHASIAQRAIKSIHEHFQNPALSRSMIAEYLSISEDHLSRIFKDEMSVGLSSYISQARINAAKDLLLNSSMSIDEISNAIGFVNTKYFYEIFKKVTHVTPSQYQMRKRNENN